MLPVAAQEVQVRAQGHDNMTIMCAGTSALHPA